MFSTHGAEESSQITTPDSVQLGSPEYAVCAHRGVFQFQFQFQKKRPVETGACVRTLEGHDFEACRGQHEFGKLVCLAADEAIAVSSHLMNMQDHACGGDCAQEDDEICGSGWCSGSGSSSSLSSSGPRGVSIPSLLAAGSSLRRSTVAARRVSLAWPSARVSAACTRHRVAAGVQTTSAAAASSDGGIIVTISSRPTAWQSSCTEGGVRDAIVFRLHVSFKTVGLAQP